VVNLELLPERKVVAVAKADFAAITENLAASSDSFADPSSVRPLDS
jgi:hypothetical protein